MGILAWLVIGAIAGWLADMFVGGGGVGWGSSETS